MGLGKDTPGTPGPLRRKAVGGPINAPQGEATHNDGALKRDNRQVFRQTRSVNLTLFLVNVVFLEFFGF